MQPGYEYNTSENLNSVFWEHIFAPNIFLPTSSFLHLQKRALFIYTNEWQPESHWERVVSGEFLHRPREKKSDNFCLNECSSPAATLWVIPGSQGQAAMPKVNKQSVWESHSSFPIFMLYTAYCKTSLCCIKCHPTKEHFNFDKATAQQVSTFLVTITRENIEIEALLRRIMHRTYILDA